MARLGITKKKKSPRATELGQLKEELRRVSEQLESRERELSEVLEQQTATSEILRVIASSPTDIQPVLDVVAENAARLCDANDAVIVRIDGNSLKAAAHCGPVPAPGFGLPTSLGQPVTRGWPVGRAIVDRETVHVHDLAASIETEFPDSK